MSDEIQITKKKLFDGTKELLRSYVLSKDDCDDFDELKQDLLLVAQDLYPDANVQAHLFGSRMTGLAKSDSDVDFYLDVDGTFDGRISEDISEQGNRVELFRKAMLWPDYQQKFKVIAALRTCRVPILTFVHLSTAIHCDISFRSGMSTKNSELIKFYLEWDPRVKFVVTGVKFFMKELLISTGFRLFNSYAHVLLALFFLMQSGIKLIPSLVCLRRMATQTRSRNKLSMVESWNCTVPRVARHWQERWIKNNCQFSGEELLVKFFTFYSNILPLGNEFVLTTYNGMITKKKKVFSPLARWPIRRFFRTYRNCRGAKECSIMRSRYEGEIDGRFYLQDPFLQLRNVTKMSNAKESGNQMHIFRKYCQMMTIILK